jgi:hypothetical protein
MQWVFDEIIRLALADSVCYHFGGMLDSLIHHAAEALTVVMGLITLVHEAMRFFKKTSGVTWM